MTTKAAPYEVWLRLPDGATLLAGLAPTQEQAQQLCTRLVERAERAGWRYVYTIREASPAGNRAVR